MSFFRTLFCNSLCLIRRFVLPYTARPTIEQTSQHPDSLRYIEQLEDYSKYQRQESVEEISSQRPVFIRPLQDLGELPEGRNAHFEAQLTPVSDPTMKVEWYRDGRPITASEYKYLLTILSLSKSYKLFARF